jgi:ABC-2 type transport system permease protein
LNSPVWLIAEREFRTYVATLSFWVALAVGPLAAGGGLMLAQNAQHPVQPVMVQIVSQNSDLTRDVQAALREAAMLEGRRLAFGRSGLRLTVNAVSPQMIELAFTGNFPLSDAGRTLVARTLERDLARRSSDVAPLTVHQKALAAPDRPDAAAAARFLSMLVLWLTLTGSLGMLLQTVVRERATRALESLLAAAAPWQIMAGKLLGVGGVSLLVLFAWLGSSAALSFAVPESGLAPAIMAELARPELLLRAALIYCLAYAFYGSITVALGAMARDSASAQNLARPMFALLVIAFFVALASAIGGMPPSLSWLLYVPVFTPFLLLLHPAGAISWAGQVGLLISMAAASFLIARFAISRFGLRENGPALFGAKAILS